jgi:hypothetical protein
MTAANNFSQNSAVNAFMGVSASAGGAMSFGVSATTVGSPVSYMAAGVNVTPPPSSLAPLSAVTVAYMASFLDQFAAALLAQDFIDVTPAMVDPGIASGASPGPDPLAQYKKNKDAVVVEGLTCTR